MRLPIVQVDAFTETAFGGNPAAVCLLEPGARLSDATLRLLAAEMNLSETAFLWPRGEADELDLRWFTPKVEVALCGHATLASAHVLFEDGVVSRDATIGFHTKSGRLTARTLEGRLELDFPAVVTEPCEVPAGLLEALGLDDRADAVRRAGTDYLVRVDSEERVRGLAPDFAKLAGVDARGVIVTALADREGADFVSRFFAPREGIDEDPVTGSAHCALSPYWAEELGRDRLTGYQASSRGGHVETERAGERIYLRGHAITVMRGELLLPS